MNALLDAALSYAARGWSVFPCAPDGKHPITENGFKDGTTDPEKIKAWWSATPRANIGVNLLASGLLAVDADTYKPDCGWADVAATHDVPPTLTQRSARGGTHFIFEAQDGAKYQSPAPGVDLKHRGYILLHPSRFDGGTYEWQNDTPIAKAPEWLKRPERTLAEVMGNAQGTTGRTLAEVEDALRYVSADCPYGTWLAVLQGLHGEFGDDAIQLAEEWSQTAPHRYREGVVEAKFSSFTPGEGVTVSTIFDMARRGGADLGQLRQRHFDVNQFFKSQVDPDTGENQNRTVFDVLAEKEAAEDPEGHGRRPLFPLLSIDDIINRPAPKWLIEDKVPQIGLGFLYSEPGLGKSFVALDMCLTISAGAGDWHGDAIECDPDAPIIYIAAEGESGFRNRIKAWLQEHPEADRASVLRRLKVLPRTVNFMQMDDIKLLLDTIEAADIGAPALVVVDTVSRAMPGADENLQKEMTLFVAACDRIRDAYGCIVLGVHHAGKSGDLRGSTVLLGAGDFVMRLSRKDKNSSVVQLACEKSKDGADDWAVSFRMNKVTLLGDERPKGGFETSRVIQPLGGAVAPAEGVVASGAFNMAPGLLDTILDAVDAAWASGDPWAGYRARVDDDRKGAVRLMRDFNMDRDRALEMLDEMVEAGILATDRTPADKSKGSGRGDRKKGYRVVRRDVGAVGCMAGSMSGGTDVFG